MTTNTTPHAGERTLTNEITFTPAASDFVIGKTITLEVVRRAMEMARAEHELGKTSMPIVSLGLLAMAGAKTGNE